MAPLTISIIIPVYNAEKYLQKCLSAIVSQTYKNWEALVIDNGSSDKSAQIIREFASKDSRIKLFFQTEIKGAAACRNVGLANASGKYLMFCDADDWYQPKMCEKMVAAIEKSGADLAMCDCNQIILGGSDKHRLPGLAYNKITMLGALAMDNGIRSKMNVVVWNKIFKKSIVVQNKIIFPAGCECEDALFVREYVCVAKKYFGIRDKLYNYIYAPGSIMDKMYTMKSANKKYDMAVVTDLLAQFLAERGLLRDRMDFLRQAVEDSLGYMVPFAYSDKEIIKCFELVENLMSKYGIIPWSDILAHIRIGDYNIAMLAVKERMQPSYARAKGNFIFKRIDDDGIKIFGIPIAKKTYYYDGATLRIFGLFRHRIDFNKK